MKHEMSISGFWQESRMVEKKKQTGHTILKYKVRLYDRHFSKLVITRELYLRVVFHFYSVLANHPELLSFSNLLLMRELETLCIGTREMKKSGVAPEYPMPDEISAPLYFRRSAINAAIDLVRKKVAAGEMFQTVSREDVKRVPMVLYQGMYRAFGDKSIELKLFDGEKWHWITYPFTGRELPAEARRMSPILVLEKKTPWLEVPLSFPVEDVRTVKERLQEEECICAVAFPDDDILAAAVILSKNGEELEHRLFRGGNQKEHQRRKLLARLEKSKASRGNQSNREVAPREDKEVKEETPENYRLFTELEELNSYYTHKISREIVDYCLEKNIRLIAVPSYDIKMSDYRTLFGIDVYRWLGRGIIKKLKYKAFGQGIVVTTVRPHNISNRCSVCGEQIKRYNHRHTPGVNYYGGRQFLCPNGHKGNCALNTARNIGKKLLSYVPS